MYEKVSSCWCELNKEKCVGEENLSYDEYCAKKCQEINPKSTEKDRCQRPAGHTGDHVSVSHSGRMKIYPSKWETNE